MDLLNLGVAVLLGLSVMFSMGAVLVSIYQNQQRGGLSCVSPAAGRKVGDT